MIVGYKIWTLANPIILAVISAVTTIVVVVIKSSPPSLTYESGRFTDVNVAFVSPGSVSGGQPIQANQKNAYMEYWWVIVVALIFLGVFFAAKFIGRTFVRSRYELGEIDEGKKIDGG